MNTMGEAPYNWEAHRCINCDWMALNRVCSHLAGRNYGKKVEHPNEDCCRYFERRRLRNGADLSEKEKRRLLFGER